MITFIKLPRESYERMWLKARLKSIDGCVVRKYQFSAKSFKADRDLAAGIHDKTCNCAFCAGI